MEESPTGIGVVKQVAIVDEMRQAYLDYAMSVIVARALPDVRDGLKPVQRRILLTFSDLGLTRNAPYRKAAKICGDVSGNYHPHGEAIVYPALVRLAQDFNMRYPLVDGQGNFGSIDGDNAAAMRYTEARMTGIAEELLADLDRNTVDWVPTYDSTRQEAVVLPAKLPNLLLNGSAGIAVGMATNIPPHNLGEVCDALVMMIERIGNCVGEGYPFDLVWPRSLSLPVTSATVQKVVAALPPKVQKALAAGQGRAEERLAASILQRIDERVDITFEELMQIVPGPDFPTGGLIIGVDGVTSAYTTGRGRIVMRARAQIEEGSGGRPQLVITELPYQVNKAALIEKIAELVRDKRVEGIADVRDESDRHGMRVAIELRRDVEPQRVLNRLYQLTTLQTAFAANLLALVDGQPRVLTLKMMLQHYLAHRKEVVTRRTQFELDKALQRSHIMEGYMIALGNLDAVIQVIRQARDSETARATLMRRFRLTEIQAQAILDLQLRRLAALERRKIMEEHSEVKAQIARLRSLLAEPQKLLYLIRDELLEMKKQYGDPRRSKIISQGEAEVLPIEESIPDQEVVAILSSKGYIKRLPNESFRPSRRGARTITQVVAREEDPAIQIVPANTRGQLMFLSDRGRAFLKKVFEIPEATRAARGIPLTNLIGLDQKEEIVSIIPMPSPSDGQYLILASRRGETKRIPVQEFASGRASGSAAIDLEAGDALCAGLLTEGEQDLLLLTLQGQAIRFSENEVRPSTRGTGGVRALQLAPGDEVVSLVVVRQGGHLVIATQLGYGKLTATQSFPRHGRGGKGVIATKVTQTTGSVASVAVVGEEDEVILISTRGSVLRTAVLRFPEAGRSAQGGQVMRLESGDAIVGMIKLPGRSEAPPPQPTRESAPLPTGAKKRPKPTGAATAAKAPKATETQQHRGKASAKKSSNKAAGQKASEAPSIEKLPKAQKEPVRKQPAAPPTSATKPDPSQNSKKQGEQSSRVKSKVNPASQLPLPLLDASPPAKRPSPRGR